MIVLITLIGVADIHLLDSSFSNLILKTNYPSYYVPLIAFPHIVSSLIIFFQKKSNPDILNILKWKMIPVLIFGCFLFLMNKVVFDIFFLVLLCQHIAGLSFGNTKILGLNIDPKELLFLKWILYPSIYISFLNVYAIHLKVAVDPWMDQIKVLGWFSCFLGLFWCLKLVVQTNQKSKVALRLTNLLVYFFSIFYFALNMNILYWGIVFILGHDVLSYIYYDNFYKNELKDRTIHIVIINYITPLIISIGLVSLATYLRFPYFVFFFQFAHYISERYSWKRESSLRKSIGL